MITFDVKDMTCGHCVSTITKALESADSHAKFTIDQSSHLVTIESTGVDPQALLQAIADAGYTPVQVENIPSHATQAKTCCGQK